MPLDSSDFTNLKLSIDDLARAERDLTAAILKDQGPGAGGGPPGARGGAGTNPAQGGAATNPANAGGAPVWQNQKGDGSPGFGLSAMRQLLAAGGGAGASAASLLGGFASGGATGLAVAAGAQAVQVGREYNQIHVAGRAAAQSAPLSFDRSQVETLRKYGEEQERTNFQESLFDKTSLFRAFKPRDTKEREFDEQRRQKAIEEEDTLAPQARALQGTRRQLEDFARAGGLREGPEGDQGRELADKIYQFNLQREKGAQEFEKWARVRDQRLTSTSPGAQGAHLGQ